MKGKRKIIISAVLFFAITVTSLLVFFMPDIKMVSGVRGYMLESIDLSTHGDRIYFLNTGSADAILIESNGKYALVDGGEDSDNPRAFNNKPAWQRFIIVAAGAILNLILGVVVVGICLSCGDLVGTREIHSFMENSVSDKSGLKAGDEIIKINNTHVYSSQGISFNMVRDTDNKLDITVIRDGEKVLVEDVEFKQFEFEDRMYIQQDFFIVGEEPNALNVLKNAVLDSASIVQMVRLSLVDTVAGKYRMKDVSGPIGTISAIAESTAEPEKFSDKILTALNFLSMITINVGMFNLLPLPALDGGRLFFILIEMIRRKPIPAKKEGIVHTVGLVLLLILMAVISVNDVIKQF